MKVHVPSCTFALEGTFSMRWRDAALFSGAECMKLKHARAARGALSIHSDAVHPADPCAGSDIALVHQPTTADHKLQCVSGCAACCQSGYVSCASITRKALTIQWWTTCADSGWSLARLLWRSTHDARTALERRSRGTVACWLHVRCVDERVMGPHA